ncbi:MAG: GDYXXLXY domain-containing protein [Persicimonas sp.]
MKRRTIIWIAGAVILLALNGLVVQKERLLARGESVYFEFAPVDPRSLIQGDYMRLDYEVARDIDDALEKDDRGDERRGLAVVRLDERGVAHFERLGDETGEGERPVEWKKKSTRVVVGADAFHFQESRADDFHEAEYAELKVTDSGSTLLVGLRDKDLEPIE